MISRQKSRFCVAILRPQALLRHTNVAQEQNQKLCLVYEIDENVWLHRESKVLETGLLKKLRINASKNRSLELACLENPVWESETPIPTRNNDDGFLVSPCACHNNFSLFLDALEYKTNVD